MSFDHAKVWKIINQSILKSKQTNAHEIKAIMLAWIELRDDRRRPGNSTDLHYAAAEHYMFSRFLVASGEVSEGQMINISNMYHAKKRWDAFWGEPNREATTANPVSKPDSNVLAFSHLGARMGAMDHRRHRVKKQPPFWRPVGELLGTKDSIYARAGTRYEKAGA